MNHQPTPQRAELLPRSEKKPFEFSFGLLFFLNVWLMVTNMLLYANSYAPYVAFMLIVVALVYYLFIRNIKKNPLFFSLVCLYCVIVPALISLFGDSIQDVPMVNVSLLLPFVISTTRYKTDKVERGCFWVAGSILLLNLLKPYISLFDALNTNSYAFLLFMGLTAVMILVQYKRSLPRLLLLAYSVYVVLGAESRNSLIIFFIISLLCLLPYPVIRNRVFFRVFYLVCLGYQLVTEQILTWIENNTFMSNLFENYIQPLFDKAWGIEDRVEIYETVSQTIYGQELPQLLFGNGEAFLHAHNGFYQMVYIYGIVGTILILVMYVCIFEMALRVMRQETNRLVAACSLALGGLFLLQGADVFMLGCKTCMFVPFFLAGILMGEYRRLKLQKTALLLGTG